MSHLSISVLGSLAVIVDGTPLSAFKYNKARALLAYLAVEAGPRHPRAELCALLWPELSEHAGRRNLSQVLNQRPSAS
jgi:DNA-binding SARP family transcriptional activator